MRSKLFNPDFLMKYNFLSAREMGGGGHRQLKANILLALSEEKLLLGQEGDQEEEIAPRPEASREMRKSSLTKMLLTSPGLLVVRRKKNAGKAGVVN